MTSPAETTKGFAEVAGQISRREPTREERRRWMKFGKQIAAAIRARSTGDQP